MKIVGLITEYNPFHNGHQYHIEQAKEICGADTAIVIMSGDYVQRGTPAIIPKHLRAEMALKCGASAVFELPVCYATGSAELFATGAISFLQELGIVDCVCFGSESNDLEGMQTIADFLLEEPVEYKLALQQSLKNGNSFPAARQEALQLTLKDPRFHKLLEHPNNILSIEYLKAIRRLNADLTPYTILRQGAGYHDKKLQTSFSSASAIRSLLAYSGNALTTDPDAAAFDNVHFSNILHQLEPQVPACCLELLTDYHHVAYPIYQNDFSLLLKYKLLNKTATDLTRYMDVSPELANRILNQLNQFFHYRQFSELLKTKELTQVRINRALLHIMLGIKKDDVDAFIADGYHYYARLLGVRKDKERVLGQIARKSSIPLLTNLYRGEELSEHGQRLLQYDILSSNLYRSVITDKYKTAFINEYQEPILKV
jgi:cytidyltransferase-like protein